MVEKRDQTFSTTWLCEHCHTTRCETYAAARLHELIDHELSGGYVRAVRYVQRWFE